MIIILGWDELGLYEIEQQLKGKQHQWFEEKLQIVEKPFTLNQNDHP